MSSQRRSSIRPRSMSAIVSTPQRQNSTHVQPNTTFQNTTLNIRKAMKRLFKSSSSSATNTATTTVPPNPTKITITPTSDDTQGRSRLSYTDDCASSRRGKSVDGRPSLDPSATNGLAIASSSAINLGLPGATSEGPPSPSKLQSPPSSFRSKFRPKSLQGLKTKSSSDNGSTRHQRQQQLHNPSSELLPSSSPPPPLPHVNAVPNGIRPGPSASADESSKSAASIAKANTQSLSLAAQPARVNGSASSETQRKTMASAKTSTSASDRLPLETRSHAISTAPPSAITSTTATVPPSEALGVLNAAYKPNTPNPRETTTSGANHMAANVPTPAPLEVTASFTEGPITAEPVEQRIPQRQGGEEEDQKKQQPLREGQDAPVVTAPRAASDGPASSDLTSRSRSGSPASPPSPPHRRAGSDEFQRPRAYTTGDAGRQQFTAPFCRVDDFEFCCKIRVEAQSRFIGSATEVTFPSGAIDVVLGTGILCLGVIGIGLTDLHHRRGAQRGIFPVLFSSRDDTAPTGRVPPRPASPSHSKHDATFIADFATQSTESAECVYSGNVCYSDGSRRCGDDEDDPEFGHESAYGASTYPWSDAENESRNSPPRPMRGSLPALRRDGSSFYMNMMRSGASTGSRTPAAAASTVPLPAEDDDEGDDDDDDDIIDEDAAMGDDAASDDDGSEEAPSRTVTTPLLGGMAKAARAMGLPFGSGSAGSTPAAGSTPKANPSPLLGAMTMTASSYFRPRHTLDQEEGPVTPTPRQRSGSAASASHRMSLVASGAPRGGLGTVQDDNDEEERQTRDLTPLQTPRPTQEFSMPIPRPAKPPQDVHNLLQPGTTGGHSSSPTSHRTSLYQTPLPTPTPSAFSDSTARETVYFDAESGGSDAEVGALIRQAAAVDLPDEQGMGSAFTTFSMGSTSTLTATVEGPVQDDNTVRLARPTVQSTASAVTVKPESSSTIPTRPEMPHSEGSGSSGGSRVSALGLDLPPPTEEATVRATRSGSTASQDIPQHAQRGRPGIPPPDYFTARPSTGSTEHPSTPGGSDMLRGVFHAKHALSPRTPGGRPAMYSHQVSHSMLDFGSMGMGGTPEDEVEPPLPERMPSMKGKGKEREGTVKRGTVKRRSPSRTPKHAIRRRSLPDMSGLKAPPPPYPKFSVREEEGKEVLPPYTCRVHFEASVMRKMEFDHPGMLAKDRSWKRVYVVLNGTTLRIFKQNPRMYPVRPVPLKVGVRKMLKDWSPGGKNGDGIVHVDELVLGASHVHLPEELLPKVDSRGAPLKKVPSQGSGGSGGAPGPSNSSRRSLDSGSRQGTRRSFDIARRGGTSRSSMSSSSNITAGSSSTALTSPINDSTADLLAAEDSEKGRPQQAVPGPSAILGATRPSNSQSMHRSTGSSILASIQPNTVLRQYTLQGAETGLASDYHKRKNVIRVRAEGEQFLIQADNVFMAIDWIETFQAGANVAADLDERQMPKVPALPRRRRRRRTQNATEGGTAEPNAGEPSRPERPGAAPREPSSNTIVNVPTPSNNSRLFGRRRDP
ncbi:hypothetical protein FRC05_004544 [Tulasnella sp. 425]|nr:hypothetical protein FRC05_004544 [Tulasnella sp. 425]